MAHVEMCLLCGQFERTHRRYVLCGECFSRGSAFYRQLAEIIEKAQAMRATPDTGDLDIWHEDGQWRVGPRL